MTDRTWDAIKFSIACGGGIFLFGLAFFYGIPYAVYSLLWIATHGGGLAIWGLICLFITALIFSVVNDI